MTSPKHTTTISGVTYDITDFMHNHPGGEDMLILASGRDATILFHSYHRDIEKVKNVLKKLPVIEGTPKPNTIDTPLYTKIKQRVNKYFEQTQQSSKGGVFMWGKSLALLLITGIFYYFGIVLGYPIACVFLGVLMAINGLAIQHDANHGSFSKYPTLNRLAGWVDDVIGGSSLMWRHQHVIMHHAYPNHITLDGDSFGNYPIMRLNPQLPTQQWYLRYQHIYGPIIYSFLGISYYFADCVNLINKNYLHIKLQPLRSIDTVVFVIGKLVHLLLFVVVPIYLHGWSSIWKLILPLQLVGSDFLASCFAVSHNTQETEYNVNENTDWAELQIRTSANWSVHSIFWWLVSGGLNFQIEHHLFPGVCHVHYPALSQIIQQVCKEESLPYNAYPTFFAIYQDHLRALKKLGSWKQE